MSEQTNVNGQEYSRAERREQERAKELFDNLMKQFVEFKNTHLREVDGDVLFEPEVYIKINDLNWGWKAFCTRTNNDPKKHLKFRFNAFVTEVDKHIEAHRKIAWLNRIMYLLKNNFDIDLQESNGVLSCYNGEVKPKYPVIQMVLSKLNSSVMHTYEIPEKFIKENFASCLDELNQEEYIYFVARYLQLQAKEISEIDFKYMLLLKIARIKLTREFNSRLKNEEPVTEVENLVQLASKLDSFFEEYTEEGVKGSRIRLDSIKCHISKIGKLYGPADMMQNCTFFEYRTAHEHFRAFIDSDDITELHKMIAVLYRPGKWFMFIRKHMKHFDGDRRRSMTAKTNPELFEKRIKLIEQLPFEVKYGIFLFFLQVEQHIRAGKLIIEGNEIDMSMLYEKSNEDSDSDVPGIGLAGLLFSLAETKVFGNVEETDRQNLWDVLLRLYQVTVERKKQLETLKNNGSGK